MTPQASPASLPVIRALLDETTAKGYGPGVLGVRALPSWQGPDTFAHDDIPVRIEPCGSALAVREAILGRARGQWLVVLTDRPDDDLGAGLLSHLIGYRLRTPDPWEAVRLRFAASGIDAALTSIAEHRQVATGLLAATPAAGWPPAPGGVLTRDHAFAAVADARLDLADPVIDLASVLRWMSDRGVVARIADLRELAGDAMTGAVLDWTARRTGATAGPLLHLLRSGEGTDAVPLGLVAGLLAGPEGDGHVKGIGDRDRIAREGLIRLEPRLGGQRPTPGALITWAAEAAAIIGELLGGDADSQAMAMKLLARSDELLKLAHAEGIADLSDLLPAGLARRLALLAGTLRSAVRPADAVTDPDQPQVRAGDLAAAEAAWAQVAKHRLASQRDRQTIPFHAAVRLSRWLAVSGAATAAQPGPPSLGALMARHIDTDAWVDSAVNDVVPGSSDVEQGAALSAVIDASQRRRAAHDGMLAAAVAADTSADRVATGRDVGRVDVWHLEDMLPHVVIPLARTVPVLLLILDGMSAGTCAEIVSDIFSAGTGWAEALLPGRTHRAAALAVLPTVTAVSRASLLSGELAQGGQDAELAGFQRLCQASGLPGELFHKKPLDSAVPGFSVATDVASAISDITGRPLVTCVLNTIDDALDRSDPGGTDWTADTVRHLSPLLDQARNAGRVVVLTADHGHVVERRQGTQRPYPEISSARSRPATPPPGPGEVLVEGQRVVLHNHRAVLAVDEQLRYGPLKAGYHGGASAAEVVVPVVVLVPGAVPEDASLRLAPPQQPLWWSDPASAQPVSAVVPEPPDAAAREPDISRKLGRRAGETTPTLFDEAAHQLDTVASPTPPGGAAARPSRTAATAAAVLASKPYAAQRRIARRVALSDEQIRHLLEALLAAPAHRLSPTQAAIALAVSPVQLRGAVLHAQQLLNVDGYAVLMHDADGVTVLLDAPLLREQFGLMP